MPPGVEENGNGSWKWALITLMTTLILGGYAFSFSISDKVEQKEDKSSSKSWRDEHVSQHRVDIAELKQGQKDVRDDLSKIKDLLIEQRSEARKEKRSRDNGR